MADSGEAKQLARRVELIAALGATALGIWWLAEMAQIFNSLFAAGVLSISGGGARPRLSEIPLLLACAAGAAVRCALSPAAYAYAVRQVRAALPVLWTLTAVAVLGIMVLLFTPELFWPLEVQMVLPGVMASWMTPLAVAVGMLAGISAVAAFSVDLPQGEGRSSTTAHVGGSI